MLVRRVRRARQVRRAYRVRLVRPVRQVQRVLTSLVWQRRDHRPTANFGTTLMGRLTVVASFTFRTMTAAPHSGCLPAVSPQGEKGDYGRDGYDGRDGFQRTDWQHGCSRSGCSDGWYNRAVSVQNFGR